MFLLKLQIFSGYHNNSQHAEEGREEDYSLGEYLNNGKVIKMPFAYYLPQ